MHKSKKVILLFVLTLVILFHSIGFAEIVATPTSAKVVVNGKLTNFEAYSIGGSNYFKLKDIAFVVNGSDKQFAVNWDGTKKVINLVSGASYTPVGSEMSTGDGKSKKAVVNTSSILKDGLPVQLTAYTIGGNNFFKLKDLAQAFNIGLTWDSSTKTVGIDTAKNYGDNSEVLLTSIIETETYTYWGEVKDGKPHGQGKMIWNDGDVYVGGFLNGAYSGQGKLSMLDGDTFVGGFLDGYYNGQGTYTWDSGDTYVGAFLNGYFKGQGTYTWPDGSIYVGEWMNDMKNGVGTFTWEDGSKYVGEWINDYFHGQGAEFDNTGKMIREGKYVFGEFVQ